VNIGGARLTGGSSLDAGATAFFLALRDAGGAEIAVFEAVLGRLCSRGVSVRFLFAPGVCLN